MSAKRSSAGVLAALDLGSNSFHMLIARVIDGQLKPVDRLRERVQLASGLDERGRITSEAQERALACLERFGQRVRELPKSSVRAVGTNTLRRAKNAKAFLSRARKALGHPIKIIPGDEEARLVYLGVAHSVANESGRRLVVDIGGGSTECILGKGFETERRASLYMGCVSFSERFFRGGRIKASRMKRAEIAARLEMQNIEKAFRRKRWQRAIGASGTILAIAEILSGSGWGGGTITPDGLARLRQSVLDAGDVESLRLPGLSADRRRVLPGGVAILLAVFESLRIEAMDTSQGALREGLLYDLLGRISQEDTRERTVEHLQRTYQVDREQAARVERTAVALWEQVGESWGLHDEHLPRYLRWAARLHEVGLAISHSGHHKHGAYLVTHADTPGFSLDGKKTLAALIRSHRRKIHLADFRELGRSRGEKALRLAVLLRLSVLLNRSRSSRAPKKFELKVLGGAKTGTLSLAFPEGWLEAQPLVRADLEQEAHCLETAGLSLSCRQC